MRRALKNAYLATMAPNTDRLELINRAVAGDHIALKVLLTESHQEVCGYVSHKIPRDLARSVDPEDVVQEAHVEVFRHVKEFELRGGDSFLRWTKAIALSRLRNAIKRHRAAKRGGGRVVDVSRKRCVEDSTLVLFGMLSAPGRTPSRQVARKEAVHAVQVALAELPDRQQRAVWLVHIEGQTVRKAAQEMGCTERAVHGLCRRGLRLMEARLRSASRFLTSAD